VDGGTAWIKRRQGIGQAVGRFAPTRGLIQLRKQRIVEADLVTLRGRPCSIVHFGKCNGVPSESSKIVAWSERSDK
jgi:hypothetical protein